MPRGVYDHSVHVLPREQRLCACGCGNTFEAICTSNRRFYGYHAMKGRTTWNTGKTGCQQAWNKGLTKETDERVRKNAESTSIGISRKINTDESYRNAIVRGFMKHSYKNIHRACQERPNKAERRLLDILRSILPQEYVYVGDGSLIVGGKCPDFLNVNKKKLIEFFGDYWHKGDDADNRVKYFRRYGYETLVVWEHELKDIDTMKTKIMKFNHKEE